MRDSPGTVYLLHFDQPYGPGGGANGRGTVQHWTTDLDRRLAEHAAGRGARLLEVVKDAGIRWSLARTWSGSPALERRLKEMGGASRRCPHCGIKPREQAQADSRDVQSPARGSRASRRAGRSADSRQPLPLPTRTAQPSPGDAAISGGPGQTAAPPAPHRPPLDSYERGAQMAARFLSARSGWTAEQVARTHDYTAGPWREAAARHTVAEAETYRGYMDTVASGLDQLRAAEQSQAVPRAEAARELRGSRRGSAIRQAERDPEMEAGE